MKMNKTLGWSVVDVTKAEGDGDGPKIRGRITTESIDRDGEVVVAQGLDTTNYDSNPVVFWNHDYNDPIGAISDLVRGDDAIEASFRFAQKPDGWEGPFKPQYVEALVMQGIVKGISIGFKPKEDGTRKATDVDRAKYGDRVHTVYSKWELMEVSIAPLPANPRALITAVSKGYVDREQVKAFAGVDLGRRIFVTVPDLGALSSLPKAVSRADRRKA